MDALPLAAAAEPVEEAAAELLDAADEVDEEEALDDEEAELAEAVLLPQVTEWHPARPSRSPE